MPTTEQLAELIAKKHKVLLQLREVGRRQAEIVNSGDTTSLLKLLALKQQLIGGLQALERELTPCYAEDPDRRIWRTPQERARCAATANECNEILREIVAMEKTSTERMTARRNEVAEQLQQVHVGTQVRSAYEAQRRTPA